MNLTLSLIKLNVLHMNSENKTDCSTSSQKQAQITTEKNNTMLSKKKQGQTKICATYSEGNQTRKTADRKKNFSHKKKHRLF
jgi:hypothetical protein